MNDLFEIKNVKTLGMQFFIVPCESVYVYILGRDFFKTPDIVASTVHHKKYHNVNDEPIIIHADLFGALLIHENC